MKKSSAPSNPNKQQAKRGSPSSKIRPDEMNQATADEFEREGLGVAPKE